MLISTRQINPTEFSLAVQQYMSGSAFSGNFLNYVVNSGYLGPLAVTTTGAQAITGSKRFFDPILVNYSGGTGAAPSARFVTDQISSLSGALTGQFAARAYVEATSGVLSGTITNMSGVLQANIVGLSGLTTGSIASLSGYVNAVSGVLQSAANLRYIDYSWFFDGPNLATGLNKVEAFVHRSFVFSGYAAGVIQSGASGMFSGSFYQRTSTNAKTNFFDFGFNSGVLFAANGGSVLPVSGMNRVGLDIYRIPSGGFTGLSIGMFGTGS